MRICWLSHTLDKRLCWGGTLLSHYYYDAFKELGYDIDLRGWHDIMGQYDLLRDYDIVFVIDYSFNPVELRKRYKIEATTAFIGIDDPRCYSAAHVGYDYYFTNSEGSIPLHKELGRENVHWLRFAYSPQVFYPMEEDKLLDVVYVGNGLATKSYEAIFDPATKYDLSIFGRDWNKQGNLKYRRFVKGTLPPNKVCDVYNHSKIVLNMHTEDQCRTNNSFIMRDWEARATGAFVLSDKFRGSEYFGENQVTSDSPEETQSLLGYYLSHDEEREAIAREGYEKIKDETYVERAKEIIQVTGI